MGNAIFVIMQATTFYIDQSTGRDIIRSHESDLQVTVYRLANEDYRPSLEQLAFYGEDKSGYLAFEAADDVDLFPAITAALTWYASERDFPISTLTVKDPRPPVKMYVVK